MKKHIIIAILLMTGMFLSVNAQDYYIEGFYERHGEGQYTLTNVNTQGIYLDGKTALTETIYGVKKHITCDQIDATMVQFAFEKATTDCPNKWEKGFMFQYWDEDSYKWKTDVEACKGQSTGHSQKDMVIMLVLDYSSSMKNNISQIRSYATNFINSISNVSTGNVHVGIIAFSGMDQARSQIFPITPLDKDNKYKFEQFIRNSNMGKETALYYSMDKAMQMIEDYVLTKGFSRKDYNGACMITFTDGLDNASINDDISVTMRRGSRNEYLGYLSNRLSGSSRKSLLGLPLESFAIGFTGSEEFTKDDLDLFRNVLQKTTPDESHFKLASRFEEVEDYFKYITRQLTERWETINMYVGESQHGKVRWVLNCDEAPRPEPEPVPDPEPESRETRSPWFGINAEFVMLDGFCGGPNLDMAFSINKTVAIGARIGLLLGFHYTSTTTYDGNGYLEEKSVGIDPSFLVGPEVKITFPNNSAVIASLGGGMVNWHGIAFLRAGYKIKKSFYFTAEALMGNRFGFGVGFGFSFGGKKRNL